VKPAAWGSGYDERWIQTLIHRHPDCLPFDEIEEGLGCFHPVCMELPSVQNKSIRRFCLPCEKREA